MRLIEPVGYIFDGSLVAASKVLTDSGGLQKEAYWLGVPCVTLRDETEWVETVQAGWNRLAGAAADKIIETVRTFDPPRTNDRIYRRWNAPPPKRCPAGKWETLKTRETKKKQSPTKQKALFPPKVAVVGMLELLGPFSKNLVRNFYELGALAAICDSSESVEANCQQKYRNVRFCREFSEVLSDPDIAGVVLTTPQWLICDGAEASFKQDIFKSRNRSLSRSLA